MFVVYVLFYVCCLSITPFVDTTSLPQPIFFLPPVIMYYYFVYVSICIVLPQGRYLATFDESWLGENPSALRPRGRPQLVGGTRELFS